MKPLNLKLVLDPMWICSASHFDLEYYTYVLLGAKQTYLANLESGFINFYEIVFHYLNLNTIIADKKVYDSQLNAVNSHFRIMELVSQLTNKEANDGKEIVKIASSVFGDVMLTYLKKQIPALENLHFHFNNSQIHKQDKVYIVCKSAKLDRYEVYLLNFKSKKNLGYSITRKVVLDLPDLKQNEFKKRLLERRPLLTDFNSDLNVIVVSGMDQVVLENGVCLTKDIILLNKLMNLAHGFDANVMLDYERMLEKKKKIPFKLKV
jgi:hypothetical protein